MFYQTVLLGIFAAANAFEETNAVPNAGRGVDVSTAMSTSSASCLLSSGYTTVIARAWKSSGTVDTASCTTLNSAKTAGILNRDVYMFPCPTCSASAASQLTSMYNYLKGSCSASWSTMIWLDIEGSQYWTGSTTQNRVWYQNLVDACSGLTGARCGVYTSASQWSAIFGSLSYSYGSTM